VTDINFATFIQHYAILTIVGTMVWMLVDELREAMQRSPWVDLIPSPSFLEPRLRPERAPPPVLLLRTHGALLAGHPRARAARQRRRQGRAWASRHPYAHVLAGSHLGAGWRVASGLGSPRM
jgi:hypothetical protein